MWKPILTSLAALAISISFANSTVAEDKVLKMSTTTSTEASGLLNVLLPAFEKETGIKVKVIAKGTGAAIRDGIDGNVDVIFVHDKARELEFVEKGYGTKRYAVMHNDFVIIGPNEDPAGIKGSKNAAEALKKIATKQHPFISRGDDSGTHSKEQEIWSATGIAIDEHVTTLSKDGKETKIVSKKPAKSDNWYFSIGQGMGKTITFAEEKQAYTISDRGTYISYKYGKKPAVNAEILFEGDELLANPYGVIPVNPAKHPYVQFDLAEKFANWLVSPQGQGCIAGYLLEGKQLFFPDAIK